MRTRWRWPSSWPRIAASARCITPACRPILTTGSPAGRCVGLASALGLGFAGIDLKITPDDEVYCFEVNPSPAFSYYESNTGQPISEGVAAALMQAERGQLATVN